MYEYIMVYQGHGSRAHVGSRLASSRLKARDGRRGTARGHNVMARELTPSYVPWAHSSSICDALLSLRVPVRNEQERQ